MAVKTFDFPEALAPRIAKAGRALLGFLERVVMFRTTDFSASRVALNDRCSSSSKEVMFDALKSINAVLFSVVMHLYYGFSTNCPYFLLKVVC